jgi:hypothetical protein
MGFAHLSSIIYLNIFCIPDFYILFRHCGLSSPFPVLFIFLILIFYWHKVFI